VQILINEKESFEGDMKRRETRNKLFIEELKKRAETEKPGQWLKTLETLKQDLEKHAPAICA